VNEILQQIANDYFFDGDNALIGKNFRNCLSIKLMELIMKEIENEEDI
jgi:hypothetical protein